MKAFFKIVMISTFALAAVAVTFDGMTSSAYAAGFKNKK